MIARRTLLLDAAIAVAIAGAALAFTALAHPPKEAYPLRWERKTDVKYKFDPDFPSGKFRDRVVDAAKEWNGLDGSLRFVKAKGKGNPRPDDECGRHYQDNVITARKLGPGLLGTTISCTFTDSSELYSFQMTFAQGEDWHRGKDEPGSGTWDALSAATHEFGHAAGRTGHFEDGSDGCEGHPTEVMCPSIAAGTADQREPKKHDEHTFADAY